MNPDSHEGFSFDGFDEPKSEDFANAMGSDGSAAAEAALARSLFQRALRNTIRLLFLEDEDEREEAEQKAIHAATRLAQMSGEDPEELCRHIREIAERGGHQLERTDGPVNVLVIRVLHLTEEEANRLESLLAKKAEERATERSEEEREAARQAFAERTGSDVEGQPSGKVDPDIFDGLSITDC